MPDGNVTTRRVDGAALPWLGPDGLEWREAGFGAAGLTRGGRLPTVLVPSEDVLLTVVDLPLPSHRQRLAALPFAVEGQLAQPLAEVHVALGPEVAPRRHLAAIVRHQTLAAWIDALAPAGLAQSRLVPDALTLPVPEGEDWTLRIEGARALVRTGDGGGFAVATEALAAAWKAAGRPGIVSYGDRPPPGLPRGDREPLRLAPPDATAADIDLRQGPYALSERRARTSLRRAGIVVGLGALAYGGLIAADTWALDRLAAERRAEAAALLAEVAPGSDRARQPPGGDVADRLLRLLPSAGGTARGRFLPLFAETAAALAPHGEGLAINSLSYSAADGALAMTLQAPDLAALQRIEAALVEAGLDATSGVATVRDGGAEARIVVRDGTARAS